MSKLIKETDLFGNEFIYDEEDYIVEGLRNSEYKRALRMHRWIGYSVGFMVGVGACALIGIADVLGYI